MKTSKGLVEYAKGQLGRPYWYGAYGQAASKDVYDIYKGMYPKYYKWEFTPEVVGQKVHDCVGMIKGYLWTTSPDDAKPKYNEKQDISANMMRDACTVTGKISTLPEIPGMLVFKDGHVGVYEGNGNVIEARGHDYGVVRTRLDSRSWTTWGRCPFIEYEGVYLHRGMKTPEVKVLQEKLLSLNYDIGSSGADGSYGGATVRGVIDFQNDHGIAPTGVYDDETKKALDEALKPKDPEPVAPSVPVVDPEAPPAPPVNDPVVDDTTPTEPETAPDNEQADDTEDIEKDNANLLSKLLKLLIELVQKLLGK